MDESIENIIKSLINNSSISKKLTSPNADNKDSDLNGSSKAIKKQELLEMVMPYLDEKSRRITEYIIASLKISEIITELKKKYS